MDKLFEDFCGSKYWDLNLTWNSETPDLTYCFQETLLVWMPCLFLWIFSPYEILRIIHSNNPSIPWNAMNVTKIILSVLLIILSVCDLTHALITDYSYPVSYCTPLIKLITYIILLTLLVYQRAKGIITSALLFFFWLFLTTSASINYRSIFLMTFSGAKYNGITDDFMFTTRMAYMPIIFLQFILSCFADSRSQYIQISKRREQKKINESPLSSASILSILTFWWANSIILLGYKRALTKQDMWALRKENTTAENVRQFDEILNPNSRIKTKEINRNEMTELTSNSKPNGILFSLLRTYWFYFSLMAILKLALSFLPYINPTVLDWIISYMSVDSQEPDWHGFLYAIIMFISPMIESFITNHYETGIGIIAMRMRSCLMNSIYKKSLRLSSTGRKNFTTGEIVNLMTIDTSRVVEMVIIHEFWSTPLQIAIALYLLWAQLGVATLAGLGLMIFLIPINGYITGKIRFITSRLMTHKDQRIKLINEMLNGIKVLKLYAWEKLFNDQVLQKRNHEVEQLTISAYFQGAMAFFVNCAPFLVAITSFATFILMDEKNVLTPQKAFVSLALFNQLRFPLNFLPRLISLYAMFTVSMRRINKYMSGDELDQHSISHDLSVKEPILVRDASFSWTKTDAQTLKNISVSVPKQKLVAIVGQVGAGKSSLLYALLGDMFKTKGYVNINGSIAYVPQQAWIQNATLQQNIIYTNALDEKKLNKVIDNCALTQDLEVLPGGQLTEIGEKGINLSGGQKQRVSMARACYSEADIYLLDDPLSALDAHVGKHIFDKVIGPNGMLKDKTRVLVTHRISVLSQCDQIIVMKDGSISECGSYKQLLERKGDFAQFLLSHIAEGNCEDIDEEDLKLIDEIVKPDLERQFSRSKSTNSSQDERLRTLTNSSTFSLNKDLIKKEAKNKIRSELTEAEKSETGSVEWTVYCEYIKRVGLIGASAVFISSIGSTSLNVASSLWLSSWSDDSNDPILANDTQWRNLRLGIYGVLGSAESIFLLISMIALGLAVLRASKILHNDMLHRIFRAPMSFFDTTPMGRILNRFSRDIDVCDTLLSMNIRMTLVQSFRAISILVVIGIDTPFVLLIILPIGVIYYLVQKLYIPTSRQLRRIESTTRSPIYTHFSETLSGVTTIRAYGTVDKFVEESNKRVDENHSSSYLAVIISRWLALRLEFLGNSIIFVNALYAVLSRGQLSPGVVGLTLSYAMTITRTLNNLVMATTNLETNIVSVERCLEYTRTPMEADWHKEENRPQPNWPQNGSISFDKYSTRYREGLELVLNKISFEVNPGERVGVVGRTGAGKSSLSLALFRIIEAVEGSLYIDGIQISKLGLYDLRSRLTIIPQDPVLFTGTLRHNLDPFEKYSDREIWLSLELAHLKDFVSSLEAGLSHHITEGGENLSLGQKQLLCLARALLRKSKIIVLDEATAAVDIETDELIQTTIRKEFKDCTIIAIAHRLNTILDYDRVLVMDRGQVAEYDSPQAFLKNTNSIFYSMAKDAELV